jgi:hypothetical protein
MQKPVLALVVLTTKSSPKRGGRERVNNIEKEGGGGQSKEQNIRSCNVAVIQR